MLLQFPWEKGKATGLEVIKYLLLKARLLTLPLYLIKKERDTQHSTYGFLFIQQCAAVQFHTIMRWLLWQPQLLEEVKHAHTFLLYPATRGR